MPWCFWTVVLEKTLESPSECKEIKPVDPKGNPPWIFIESTDSEAEAEAPTVSSPNGKNWLIGNAGKDWKKKEKGSAEDEMVRKIASLTQQSWIWANSVR